MAGGGRSPARLPRDDGPPARLGDAPGAALAAGPQRALYLGLDGEGRVTAFNGHVDLGTGIRTALAQIVAEELDVPLSHVAMDLGHTATAPDQGGTIASETIQIAAIPLRQAAATARRHLVEAASRRLNRGTAELVVEAGHVRVAAEPDLSVAYGDLVRGARTELTLDPERP